MAQPIMNNVKDLRPTAMAMKTASQLDSDIFLFFNNGFRSQFFDRAMMLFTGKFIWVPMYR